MIKVLRTKRKSDPERLGVSANCSILKINGSRVDDQLDIAFLSDKKNLNVELKNTGGRVSEIKIPSASLRDIEFEPLKAKKCGCKCIFCFIDQLPKGLRKSLYHKDEDYRFSYLYGNYVTLENLKKTDLQKIVKYRLSPLYVSVHAANPEVRGFMLGHKGGRPILPLIEYLAKNRITTHCQVVLCKGINDGEILKQTIRELSEFYPQVETLAVVPVGLTGHRGGLYELDGIDEADSRKAFALIEEMQNSYIQKFGSPFVYLSDEFYILAGKKIPGADFYGDFSQMENGVGLLRSFMDDAEKVIKSKRLKKGFLNGKAIFVTGEAAWKYINPYIKKLSRLTQSDIELAPVRNALFGGRVNVAGLIGGSDILKALKGVKPDYLFLPNVMLRDKHDTFLDDLTAAELGRRLGCRIHTFRPLLSCLYKELLKAKDSKFR